MVRNSHVHLGVAVSTEYVFFFFFVVAVLFGEFPRLVI